MGVGMLVLFILAILYCFLLLYIFTKRNNKRQRIFIVALPFILFFAVAVYGFFEDFRYSQKLKKYPQYNHISFDSPIEDIKTSIVELKSVFNIKKWPYSTAFNPISFQDVLTERWTSFDSVFTNDSIGIKNLKFLQKNGIHSFAIISNTLFVTYQDSISLKEHFPYLFLQLEGVTKDRTKFRVNEFDTIDQREGLYLLRKIPLN